LFLPLLASHDQRESKGGTNTKEMKKKEKRKMHDVAGSKVRNLDDAIFGS